MDRYQEQEQEEENTLNQETVLTVTEGESVDLKCYAGNK